MVARINDGRKTQERTNNPPEATGKLYHITHIV